MLRKKMSAKECMPHSYIDSNIHGSSHVGSFRTNESTLQLYIATWSSFSSFPFSSNIYRDQQEKPRTAIVYVHNPTWQNLDTVSCVNMRECGDRLLCMFLWIRAVCVFEQVGVCNKRIVFTQDRFKNVHIDRFKNVQEVFRAAVE